MTFVFFSLSAFWPPLLYFVLILLFLLHSQSMFLPRNSGGLDLMRLLWLIQGPDWVFNLVFRCGMFLSKRCVSNKAPPPQIKVPGTVLHLWQKGVILGLSPFPHKQVADNNSGYTPSFPNPIWSVFWSLSQWSFWHSLKGGGQISWTTSLWAMIFIKVIVVAGPCYS